jgi:hypothetical protein
VIGVVGTSNAACHDTSMSTCFPTYFAADLRAIFDLFGMSVVRVEVESLRAVRADRARADAAQSRDGRHQQHTAVAVLGGMCMRAHMHTRANALLDEIVRRRWLAPIWIFCCWSFS